MVWRDILTDEKKDEEVLRMRVPHDSHKMAPSRRASGALPVQVIRHEVIAPNVITLFLAQPGTTHAPGPYLPGQFITLVIPGPDGEIYRSYSLCGNSHPYAPLEITLKRIPGGVVSNYLYDHVKVGMILHILPPRGTFTLPTSLRPEQTFVFVAVGSGITPISGFLRTIAALPSGSRPNVQLHYASRSPQETIYRTELLQLEWLYQKHYLKTEGIRMTPRQILANASPLSRDAQWYICGPEAFNLQLRDTLVSMGVPHNFIHVETFVDQSRRQRADGASRAVVGQITIQETGAILDVRAQETLLEALERQGYQPEFSCRAGMCGTCQLHVLRGQVHNPGDTFLTAAERRNGTVLACLAQPQGNVVIETGGIPPRGTSAGTRTATRRRATQKYRLRLTAAVLTALLTAGLWQLTDHAVSASSSGATISLPAPSSSSLPTPASAPTITLPATSTSGGSQATPAPTPIPMPTPATTTGSS